MNPHQIQLLTIDAYRLIAEIIPDLRGAIIDGGANIGKATEQMRRAFPNAPIHAFEPVSEPFRELEQRAAACGAHAHRLALGEHEGEAEIRVNQNLWTSSLLPASSRGHAFHDDWCRTVRTERVRVVRLDAWAAREGIDEIGLLKLDLQGFELPALRGAKGVLARVSVIYSEAQIVPEYDGAGTFSQIDEFLRDAGFGLYQITDLCLKGAHAEPSCCDGLWIRSDILARVRTGPTPRAILEARDRRSMLMADALRRCRDEGFSRVAIYGAGAHTAACGSALACPPVEVVAIIDDAPTRPAMWRIPIVSARDAIKLGIEAVVLSSDRAEAQMLAQSERFLDAGIGVVSLYGRGGVTLHAPAATP